MIGKIVCALECCFFSIFFLGSGFFFFVLDSVEPHEIPGADSSRFWRSFLFFISLKFRLKRRKKFLKKGIVRAPMSFPSFVIIPLSSLSLDFRVYVDGIVCISIFLLVFFFFKRILWPFFRCVFVSLCFSLIWLSRWPSVSSHLFLEPFFLLLTSAFAGTARKLLLGET